MSYQTFFTYFFSQKKKRFEIKSSVADFQMYWKVSEIFDLYILLMNQFILKLNVLHNVDICLYLHIRKD